MNAGTKLNLVLGRPEAGGQPAPSAGDGPEPRHRPG